MVQSRMRMRMRMLYAPYATCVDESHLKIEDIAGQRKDDDGGGRIVKPSQIPGIKFIEKFYAT